MGGKKTLSALNAVQNKFESIPRFHSTNNNTKLLRFHSITCFGVFIFHWFPPLIFLEIFTLQYAVCVCVCLSFVWLCSPLGVSISVFDWNVKFIFETHNIWKNRPRPTNGMKSDSLREWKIWRTTFFLCKTVYDAIEFAHNHRIDGAKRVYGQ